MKSLAVYLAKLAATVVAAVFVCAFVLGATIAVWDNYLSYNARLKSCERVLVGRGHNATAVRRVCERDTRP